MRTGAGLVFFALALIAVSCVGGARKQSGTGGGPEIVQGGVIFRYYDPKAQRVNLVGDFNNWSPKVDAMTDENGDGEWTLFYDLKPGVYQYKFVVDGVKWIADPSNPERVSDGFEGQNSVVRVPSP